MLRVASRWSQGPAAWLRMARGWLMPFSERGGTPKDAWNCCNGSPKFRYKSQWTLTGRDPNVVAHDCRYPLSRYTCHATCVAADFLDFGAFCRCSTGVALHPLKILVSHLPPRLALEVSHRNLGLKRCRATRGCRSYSCGCRAALCN